MFLDWFILDNQSRNKQSKTLVFWRCRTDVSRIQSKRIRQYMTKDSISNQILTNTMFVEDSLQTEGHGLFKYSKTKEHLCQERKLFTVFRMIKKISSPRPTVLRSNLTLTTLQSRTFGSLTHTTFNKFYMISSFWNGSKPPYSTQADIDELTQLLQFRSYSSKVTRLQFHSYSDTVTITQ